MKDSIAILFNTNKLGGAERSMLLQLSMVPDAHYTFYIPALSIKSEIAEYIVTHKLGEVVYFDFPASLYKISRSNMFISVSVFKDLFNFIENGFKLSRLKKFKHVYLNGNKVALLYFILSYRFNFQAKITWHLRDYFQVNKIRNIIWMLLTLKCTKLIEIICNSNSVKESLNKSIFCNAKITVVYNPSGTFALSRKIGKIKTLGFASMMAPWKGIHELQIFSWLFEERLKEIGIEEIKIFGDDLYMTSGEHSFYKTDLNKISKKMPSSLITFQGLKDPSVIFNEIDCLIHYSLEKEPFGRVIIEAYEAGIPVITTGLGGAGEILDTEVNGFKVIPYDREDLFNKIEKMAASKELVNQFISKSKIKSIEIQKNISEQMNEILSFKEVS